MNKTKLFIKRSKRIHNNKYGYKKTVYNLSHDKVIITCPIHGDFEQKAYAHTNGKGCFICGGKAEITENDFLSRSKSKHGNKYGYDKVIFINRLTPVLIKCDVHGYFTQTPKAHMRGNGCSACAIEYVSKIKLKTTEKFISDAENIHGKKYKYNNSTYINDLSKVIITCRKHGNFEQQAGSHLQGAGCPYCKTNSKGEDEINLFLKMKNINFIRQYKIQDFSRYSYDFYLVDYNLLIEYDGKQHFNSNSWGGEEELKNIQKEI